MPVLHPEFVLIVTTLRGRDRTCEFTYCCVLQPPGDVAPQASITDCGAQMIVRGNISSRAFVHGKATVAEATQVSGCLCRCRWGVTIQYLHGMMCIAIHET